MISEKLQKATFAGGCFWCTEAIFERLYGVEKVESGYAGGDKKNANYKDVSTGKTDHAESVQIHFDPKITPYQTLVEIFFATHDPTTVDRQGADTGRQYRSAIFYHNEDQKVIANTVKESLENEGRYKAKIVTEITPFTSFYKAEDYHQDFYYTNPNHPYCQVVIDPKINKLVRMFGKGES